MIIPVVEVKAKRAEPMALEWRGEELLSEHCYFTSVQAKFFCAPRVNG
jgi:hypothetical protein